MKIKKYIYPLAMAFAIMMSSGILSSCESYDEVPPRNESTTNKAYKIPDPTPMSTSDYAEFNSIRDEYTKGTNLKQ